MAIQKNSTPNQIVTPGLKVRYTKNSVFDPGQMQRDEQAAYEASQKVTAPTPPKDTRYNTDGTLKTPEKPIAPPASDNKSYGGLSYGFIKSNRNQALADLMAMEDPATGVKKYTQQQAEGLISQAFSDNLPKDAKNARYASDVPTYTGATKTYDQFQAERDSYGKPVDENAIREQVRKEQQARINAINDVYDSMVGQENVAGQGRLGSSRAINARSGTIGQDFGNSQDAKVAELNAGNVNAINKQRQLDIQGVYNKIDQMTADKVKAQKEEALGKANAYIDYLAGAKTQAQSAIAQAGKAGLTLQQLKDQAPDKLKSLLETSGYNEFELDMQLNANRDPANKIDYKIENKNGNLLVYGVDPLTGKTTFHTEQLPPEFSTNDVKLVEGELWSISPDGKSATKIGGGSATSDKKLMEVSPGASLYDPNTGKFIGTAPSSNAGSEFKKVTIDGVDYQVNSDGSLSKPVVPNTVPTADKVAKADDVIAKIDSILNNKDLSKAIGPFSSNIPEIMRTGARNDVDAAIKSLVAGVAIENLSLLKGPMSDKDIAFIKEASSGLNTNMSEEGFKKRLNELKNKFVEIKNKAGINQPSGGGDDIDNFLGSFNIESQTSLKGHISSVYPQGSTGGQCGDFAHKLVDFPSVGDSKSEKIASVQKFGIPADQWRNDPQVGDVIITNENPTYGHVAVINKIFPDGSIQLSESNYRQKTLGREKVSHDRIISINSPKIYGAIRGDLKSLS